MDKGEAKRLLDRWRARPELWMTEILGFHPLPMQLRMCEGLGSGARTVVVASCQNSGKDSQLGRLVAWYYNCFPNSKVIVTGPTEKQVRTIHGYVTTAMGEALTNGVQLAGNITQERIYNPDKPGHEIVFFASKDYQPEAAASWHAERLLVVVTEASGVDERVITALEGVASGAKNQVMLVGNPLRPFDAFHRRWMAPGAVQVTIGAPDCPNFETFGITRRDLVSGEWEAKLWGCDLPYPAMLSPQHAAAMIARLGENDPDVVARLWGEFPMETDDGLFTAEMVEAAKDLWSELEGLPSTGEPTYGVDPAYFGSDETVVAKTETVGERRAVRLSIVREMRHKDPLQIADEVWGLISKQPGPVRVDEGTPGPGVIAGLSRKGADVEGIAFAEAPEDPDYANKRVEMHFQLRDLAMEGRLALNPADSELHAQMLALRRLPPADQNNKKRLERKEDFKKRVGRSPDHLDSACLAVTDGCPRIQVF